MCGITGLIRIDKGPVDIKALTAMTEAIRHRGPDDEGYFVANTQTPKLLSCKGDDTVGKDDCPHISALGDQKFDIAFGFRRLSILDLSFAGHQPMASPDGKAWIIFNGEVYNYIELKRELEQHGHTFSSGTDTEVVLAAYRTWGKECLKKFRGMWALCIADFEKNEIFAARDPFGIKPFYFTNQSGYFAFASELKALLAVPWMQRKVNAQSVWDYLQIGRTGVRNESIVSNIRQLPPAHHLTISLDVRENIKIERYWDIDTGNTSSLSREEAVEAVREQFRSNITQHLRSDVTVAATLSGGIDSSAIVGSIHDLMPKGSKLNTFSYIADAKELSEENYINIVAHEKGVKGHKVTPSANQLVEDLDDLIRMQDEPFGSTTIYAQYRVFRMVKQAGIKVILDGQGADEMLAGYRGYRLDRLASMIRSGSYLGQIRLLWNTSQIDSIQNGVLANWVRALKIAARYPDTSPVEQIPVRPGSGGPALDSDYFHDHGVLPQIPIQIPGQQTVLRERLKSSMLQTSLPELLRFEDRNSMGHSIESRVPFLTTDLVELVLSLPENYILSDTGETKSVFRDAMRGLVPDVVLDRRDKIGFDTPEEKWMSTLGSWVTDNFEDADQNRFQALNLPNMRNEWASVMAGNKPYSKKYWRWINLIRWAEQFNVTC